MLESGFYLAPSQFEVAFISEAHTDVQLKQMVGAVEKSLSSIINP